MRFTQLLESYFDNQKGIGAVPWNADIDYFGLRVQMKPSVFLKLAEPLSRDKATSVDWLKQQLQAGKKIGSPFLKLSIPDSWINGDYSQPCRIQSHDGRNRMYALQELQGDQAVEVHLIPGGTWRSKHINDEFIQALNREIIPENKKTPVKGPWFSVR